MIRKCLVAASVLFSLVGLVGAYADVYVPTVTFWGNPAALLTETWSVPVYSCANACIALTVNSYLISRFYGLSKNIFVTLVLCLIALFAFVMAFLVIFLYPGVDEENFQKVKKLSITWSISCVVSDVSIATSLVLTLRRMKSGFMSTNRLIRRVVIVSIQNGCATSIATIGGMIGVIVKINSNIGTIFFFLLSPLYLLTLLSNFNLRESGKSGSRTWSSSRNGTTPNTSIVIDGIHIGRPNMNPTQSEIERAGRRQQNFEGSLNQKSDPNAETFREEQIDFRPTLK
ncbi:hypothetical protein MVEN_00210400 [Mycena venus]|uniref:DUF6534 domain-containing protein n=1 Tax=Mycena venus TaxID=2733690 RepID=A0A8H6Z0R3_9AGAR|nr:hypothetical protein MVEN_00210400 [Mycena venus]